MLAAVERSVQRASKQSDWLTPPQPDEFEFTLFGPGFGECAVVHLGANVWMVVDSCIDSSTGEQAAISYLKNMKLEPENCVRRIVATHWHDDHIRGMSELVRTCVAAQFCCPASFTSKEFQSFTSALNQRQMTAGSSGAREVHRVFDILIDRKRSAYLAVPNRVLFAPDKNETGHGQVVEVKSLSPSDRQVELFYGRLGQQIEPSLPKTRIISEEPNDLSVVIWIQVGNLRALLGADLEETGDERAGWSAILRSEECPNVAADLFKVAHHGSKNGHHPDVWSRLLSPDPFAVLSPWNRGRKLPTPEDIARITKLTRWGFATATSTQPNSSVLRPPVVAKQLKEMGVKLTRAEGRTGAFRLRAQPHLSKDKWEITLRGEAYHFG